MTRPVPGVVRARARARAVALAAALALAPAPAGRAAAEAPAAGTPAVAAPGAAHVTGQVNTIQRPLEGAQVVVIETGAMARSDSLGRFDLGPLGPGVYTVRIVAVGYAAAAGTVSVAADGTSPPSSWLLKPLHPDGQGLTHGLAVPRTQVPAPDTGLGSPAPAAPGAPGAAPPAPAVPVPGPAPGAPQAAPVGPVLGLYQSEEEEAARATLPGPLGELLPQMALSDSLTAVSAGTGQPGAETWRQWAERLGAWATANPQHARAPLARRATAYARTRLAFADGRTWAGYQAARQAREAIALARLDAAAGSPEAAFLDTLGTRLDAEFVPGSAPPRPAPAPHRRARHHRRSRRAPQG